MIFVNIADWVLFPFLAAVSVYLIGKHENRGILMSFLAVWILPYVWGVVVLSAMGSPRMNILDHIWLLIGWIPSGLWCFVVYSASQIFKRGKNKLPQKNA